ncbi:MAG: hypothetical protein ACE10K_06035 [Rhodothermales bacterium]
MPFYGARADGGIHLFLERVRKEHHMPSIERVPLAMLVLRLGVFVVMAIFTIDKLFTVERAITALQHFPLHPLNVFLNFTFIGGLTKPVMYAVGVIELAIIVGFLLGFKKRITYGAVLLFHAISTISTYNMYVTPFEGVHLLYFAAWPMLAACFVLYYLRDLDTKWVIEKGRSA